jgi:transglutaminase-like putative cysteine protease
MLNTTTSTAALRGARLPSLTALPRDARDTLFLLVVVAWVVLPQVGNLPLWCSLLTGAVLLWRGWLAWSSKPLPGGWTLLAVLAATIAATLLTHKTLLGRDAGVTMIVVLVALKTLELRAKRDAFVIFFLSFFTMLTNFFFSQSLLTAAAMLIALLGLLTALVNAHMPVGKPPLMKAARTAFGMALLGAPIMAVLFLLFPRMAPLWGIPGDAMSGRSGLSSSMQVGTIASLALDDTIAMRVKFEGAAPPQRNLYFRGPVLSRFDGREWRPLRTQTANLRAQMPSNLTVNGPAINYEVTLEPTNRPWIFVLDAAATPPKVPGYEAVMTSELQWLTDKPVTDIVRYKAQSHVDYTHGSLLGGALMEYTELPPDSNPATRNLAKRLMQENPGGDAMTLAQAAMRLLSTGGYVYTLDPGVYGDNTADEFWFDRKQGFCEHIASAFVVLMRAANVPARVVTGYQGGEANSIDGFWVVRQSDAHAWAEILQVGRGWVRVDPTSAVSPGRVGTFQRLQPQRGVIASAIVTMSPGLSQNLRAAWEAMNNGWNQWVLNYTQSKQLNLLKDIGFESPSWEDLSYVLIAIVVFVSLCGAAWTLWERSQHDPWLRLLARARKELHKAGVEVPATTPPRRMAQVISQQFGPAASSALADWLLRLEALRYAPAGRASQDLAVLQREFKQLSWPPPVPAARTAGTASLT